MKPQELFKKSAQAIESAKTLFISGDADGACNRAYYAMFDAARAVLLATDAVKAETIKTHGGLISAFSLHFVKKGLVSVELGKTLNKIEDLRLLADYSGDPVEPATVKVAIEQAEMFVKTIYSLYLNTEKK